MFRQVRHSFHYPNTTPLRRDPLYYNLYCVGLNAFFASVFPLALLLFFNVSTLAALARMGRMGKAKRSSRGLPWLLTGGVSGSHSHSHAEESSSNTSESPKLPKIVFLPSPEKQTWCLS